MSLTHSTRFIHLHACGQDIAIVGRPTLLLVCTAYTTVCHGEALLQVSVECPSNAIRCPRHWALHTLPVRMSLPAPHHPEVYNAGHPGDSRELPVSGQTAYPAAGWQTLCQLQLRLRLPPRDPCLEAVGSCSDCLAHIRTSQRVEDGNSGRQRAEARSGCSRARATST